MASGSHSSVGDPRPNALLGDGEAGFGYFEKASGHFLTSDAVLLTVSGFDGAVKWANAGHEALLGHRPDELLGRPFLDLVHPSDVKRTGEEAARLKEGTPTESFEVRLRHSKGHYRWFLFSATPNADEELVYSIGKDITDRKGAEEAAVEAEELFRRAFEGAPIGMALMSLERDRTGCFLRVNKALCEITGYSEAELIGADLDDITHPDDFAPETRYLPWVLAAETTQYEVEKRLLHPDGRTIWALLSASLVTDAHDRPLYLIAQIQDITKRKEAEQAFWESSERLQATIDNAAAVIYLKDSDGRFLLVNRRFEMLYDLRRMEVIGRTVRDVFAADVADTHESIDREVITTGLPIQLEEVVNQNDGSHTYISIRFPLFDADGVPQGVGNISTDITARKRAEDEVRQSAERFRQILNTAHDAFVSMNADGTIRVWNPAAEATFGWSADEAIGRNLANTIIPPRYRQMHARGLHEFLATGRGPVLNKRIEIEALHRDGHEFPVEMTISAARIGDDYTFNAFMHDISERRRTEQVVAAHNDVTLVLAESSTLEDAAPRLISTLAQQLGWEFGAYWAVDESQQLLRCQATYHARNGGPHELEELTRDMTFPPGVGMVGRVWEAGEPRWSDDVTKEADFLRADAAVADGLHGAICLPVRSEERVIGVMEFFSREVTPPDRALLDLTATIGTQVGQFIERKRAEEALREVQEGFRRAFEDAPIGMALVGVIGEDAGRLLQVNRALAEITGYPEEQLREMRLGDFTHPEDVHVERPLLDQLLAGEIPYYQLEERYLRDDGGEIWVIVNSSTVHSASGRLLFGIVQVQDITERKASEDSLAGAHAELELRATELERSNADLQQFAYAASHDLSEPLRMVSSYVQLLARRYRGQLDSDADEFIHFAVDGVNRMQALIDGLLLYSRAGTSEYELTPVDTSEVVRQTLTVLDQVIAESGANVTVDPLPTVHADPTQMAQLFQNLVGNALKFSEGPPEVHVSAEREPHAWRFCVADNGIGIDPKYADRIFTVFQRLHSRETYKGSGVGLAICKRVVERHGGRIWVEPNDGGGSRFCFTIPARDELDAAAPGEPGLSKSFGDRSGRISDGRSHSPTDNNR